MPCKTSLTAPLRALEIEWEPTILRYQLNSLLAVVHHGLPLLHPHSSQRPVCEVCRICGVFDNRLSVETVRLSVVAACKPPISIIQRDSL